VRRGSLLPLVSSANGGSSDAAPRADSTRVLRSAALVFVVALVALVLSAAAAGRVMQDMGPQISLVTPVDGATVVYPGASGAGVAFGWRTDWGDAPSRGTVLLTVRVATDPGLTQNASENTFSCKVRSPGCKSSFRANRLYAGRYYWRVTMTGAAQATSATWSFVAIRRGGPELTDRVKPHVRALAGVAQRGQTAFFSARVSDNGGVARLRATLLRRGREVTRASAPFRPVVWERRQTLFSNRPLPRGLPPGGYRLCFTAWDRAGNAARSCAPYLVH
jgi:hypothetical protein